MLPNYLSLVVRVSVSCKAVVRIFLISSQFYPISVSCLGCFMLGIMSKCSQVTRNLLCYGCKQENALQLRTTFACLAIKNRFCNSENALRLRASFAVKIRLNCLHNGCVHPPLPKLIVFTWS